MLDLSLMYFLCIGTDFKYQCFVENIFIKKKCSVHFILYMTRHYYNVKWRAFVQNKIVFLQFRIQVYRNTKITSNYGTQNYRKIIDRNNKTFY